MINEANLEYILNFNNNLIIDNNLISKNNLNKKYKNISKNYNFNIKNNDNNKIYKKNKLEIIKKIFLSFFYTSLKTFIEKFYECFDYSKETLIISLFYLNKFYKNNYSNNYKINHFYKNINLYFLTSIILSLKYTLDDYIDTKYICISMNINHHSYLETELFLLKSLDWNCSICNNEEYSIFKKNTQPYMD